MLDNIDTQEIYDEANDISNLLRTEGIIEDFQVVDVYEIVYNYLYKKKEIENESS